MTEAPLPPTLFPFPPGNSRPRRLGCGSTLLLLLAVLVFLGIAADAGTAWTTLRYGSAADFQRACAALAGRAPEGPVALVLALRIPSLEPGWIREPLRRQPGTPYIDLFHRSRESELSFP